MPGKCLDAESTTGDARVNDHRRFSRSHVRAAQACLPEGVTGGISEDPEARLPVAVDPSGTQGKQFLLGLVGIAHPDVEMQLPTMKPASQRRQTS